MHLIINFRHAFHLNVCLTMCMYALYALCTLFGIEFNLAVW